ncbi:MAG: HD-GYP domain-containing protein [Deltaproteobacteria bacterium]|jgi:HD-GYP domain-containing protein (c-di-GMP phosphodiesterase class II)|nr:HD-GYP domain-containing protein [Deltaproteobacteria bacterium]
MDISHFFRIRLSTIRPDKKTAFDIYIHIDNKAVLFRRAGDVLFTDKIETLHSRDTGNSFFIKMEDKETYRSWVKEEINSESINNKQKANILRESSLAIMEDLFENPDVNEALNESKPIITDFLHFMDQAPESVGYLLSLSGHDFYTYNHSLDVSIYSLGLGKVLGFDSKQLENLGLGCLFHDIGKRNVALEILCKKGPLDEAEWEQMKRHPQYGLVILNQNENISDEIKAACFEHHESWAGNGYPQQIAGNEIHPFARIVAICDTYDAMTTQRSYNTPLKPTEALTMMRDKLAGRYDPDMLKAMYSVLFKIQAA